MKSYLILASVLILGAASSVGCLRRPGRDGATPVTEVTVSAPITSTPRPPPTTAPPTRTPTASPVPSPTPEPIVPTATAGELSQPTLTPARDHPTASAPQLGPRNRERFGVGASAHSITRCPVEWLGVGWYMTWQVEVDPARPGGIPFWQMVRVSEDGFRPNADLVREAARANPGSVWLIGNEPDVRWQDNTTPEKYAVLYHQIYYLIKETDPDSRIAIGGVSQPTPLRLGYLERVLTTYEERFGEPMPVDIWNVHAFILREERDSWGVDIPPGMDADTGVLREIDDNDNMAIFRDQIISFRRWMADHGQRDRPLVVSEYGVVMPADYGFDTERVKAFMYATFEFFLTAVDEDVGYPADDNRLVQWWNWFSLENHTYPRGNLCDLASGTPTELGVAFARYVSSTANE